MEKDSQPPKKLESVSIGHEVARGVNTYDPEEVGDSIQYSPVEPQPEEAEAATDTEEVLTTEPVESQHLNKFDGMDTPHPMPWE